MKNKSPVRSCSVSRWLNTIAANHVVAIYGIRALQVVLLMLWLVRVCKLLTALVAIAPLTIARVVPMIPCRFHHYFSTVPALRAARAHKEIASAFARYKSVRSRLEV